MNQARMTFELKAADINRLTGDIFKVMRESFGDEDPLTVFSTAAAMLIFRMKNYGLSDVQILDYFSQLIDITER